MPGTESQLGGVKDNLYSSGHSFWAGTLGGTFGSVPGDCDGSTALHSVLSLPPPHQQSLIHSATLSVPGPDKSVFRKCWPNPLLSCDEGTECNKRAAPRGVGPVKVGSAHGSQAYAAEAAGGRLPNPVLSPLDRASQRGLPAPSDMAPSLSGRPPLDISPRVLTRLLATDCPVLVPREERCPGLEVWTQPLQRELVDAWGAGRHLGAPVGAHSCPLLHPCQLPCLRLQTADP